MKKISAIIFISLLVFNSALKAQVCDAVTAEVTAPSPQTGSYNYFGVKVTLSQLYSEDVTVTGYIYVDGSPNLDNPYTLIITAGTISAESNTYFFQTSPADYAAVEISSVTPCPNEITVNYAGVTITYEINNNILRFNSMADVNTVLNKLDDDYENHNVNYENQYPNLTAEQLDDMDAQTGFDYLKTFRDFESLFSGFTSKRSEIENTETVWLANNFTGTDPDDIDLTFDDAENTIFNSDYSFKTSNDVYQLTSSGMYINGVLQGNGGNSGIMNNKSKSNSIFASEYLNSNRYNSGPIESMNLWPQQNAIFGSYNTINSTNFTDCKSNKKDHQPYPYDNGTKRFELKVAINSIAIRSGVKGKVIHFKKKNGNWKRSRIEMAAGCAGTVYEGDCSNSFQFIERNPYSGYKKRNELKAKRYTQAQIPGNETIWKTYSGQLAATFDTPGGMFGNLPLIF